jgi:hypothetical protein
LEAFNFSTFSAHQPGVSIRRPAGEAHVRPERKKMIQLLLPSNPKAAPKKKFRGRGSYIRKVLAEASTQAIGIGHSTWYDQWHYHADWDGYGNLCWRIRATILHALATAFERFVKQLQELNKPYQVWIYLNASDSGQDAVFVHTQNPNQSEFPVIFEEVHWGLPELSDYFNDLIPGYDLRAGTQNWMGADIYFIYSPGFGIPLESK